MKAAVYRGNHQVVVEDVPVPTIEKGEVLVKIDCCSVCPTDLKKIEYDLQTPPRIYGHEMAGTIVEMGKGVKNWRKGDRVTVVHHTPCHKCYFCKRTEFAQCPLYKKTGTTAGFEPSGGGFSEYIRVMPWIVKDGMFKIPPKISFEEASFIEPVNTCLKGVDRLHLRKNDTVLVFGQGPIGLLLTQCARVRGGKVIGLDLMDQRRQMSLDLGASLSIDPREASVEETIKKFTDGRGADAAIVAVPSKQAVEQAIKLVRLGGKVLLFAHTKKNDFLNIDAGDICVDEKTLLGSYSSDARINREVARLIFTHKIKVKPLISHHFALDKITDAFHLAAHPSENSFKIMVTL